MLGRILKTDHALVYRWIRSFGENLPEPKVSGTIREMEFFYSTGNRFIYILDNTLNY
jgi:hypothetical protein